MGGPSRRVDSLIRGGTKTRAGQLGSTGTVEALSFGDELV